MHMRIAALAIGLLWLVGGASAQSVEPKQKTPNEAEVILQDSKKKDPETPKEVTECMQQWGPQTQMSKEEWAASCRRTLQYFPEKP
jgi:hypothetical protein